MCAKTGATTFAIAVAKKRAGIGCGAHTRSKENDEFADRATQVTGARKGISLG